jgi:hypothetical protein
LIQADRVPSTPPREIEIYDLGVGDTFATGLARIESLGPRRRLVFFVEPHLAQAR